MTWRWPWVSRTHHAAALRDHVALNDLFREAKVIAQHSEREAWRRYDDLFARYHMLKLQGATIPEPARTAQAPKVDPVLVAINAACARHPELRPAMLRQVAIDRAADLTDERIILRIQRGNRPADECALTTPNPADDRLAP